MESPDPERSPNGPQKGAAQGGAAQERVCFTMRLKPDRVDDYLAAHDHVWPEMLQALRESGWHDYSLFVDPPSGLVVGYLVTDDYEAAQAEMARRDVNTRWQATMAPYFVSESDPDSSSTRLTEYFHLE